MGSYGGITRMRGVGYSWKFLAVMLRPVLQILTLLQTVTGPWLYFYFFHGQSSTKFINVCYIFQQVNKVKQFNASKTSLKALIRVLNSFRAQFLGIDYKPKGLVKSLQSNWVILKTGRQLFG